MKGGIKTLAMWLIIGIIFIVLLTSILDNSNNKLAYSELIEKIEEGTVAEIEISADGTTAEVKLKDENFIKQVNIPSIDNLMNNLQQSMSAGTITVTEKSESVWMFILNFMKSSTPIFPALVIKLYPYFSFN